MEFRRLKGLLYLGSMKTVEQWLKELPEPYRTQALENLVHSQRNIVVDDIVKAVLNAFAWGDTDFIDQGFDYWRILCNRLLAVDREQQKEKDAKE